MRKILIPAVDQPISSDTAYQVAELADALNANILLLFLACKLNADHYIRGNLAIEVFEEAVQDYELELKGIVMAGDPAQTIARMAESWEADLILLGTDEETQLDIWHDEIATLTDCPVETLQNMVRISNLESN